MIEILLALLLAQETVTSDKRCIECHDKQHDDWTESVHRRNAIGCVACHGSDQLGAGDKPHQKNKETFLAGTRKTSHVVCVKCHEGVVRAFEESSHWEDTKDDEGKVKSCMSCHTHHATVPADRVAIRDQSCIKCHKKNSAQMKIMESYVGSMGALQEGIERLRKRVEHPVPGVSFRKEGEALESSLQLYREARVEQHRTARGKAGGFKGLEESVPAAAGETDRAYSSLDSRQREAGKRSYWLLGFLGILGLYLLLVRAKLIRWGHAA